MSAKRVSLALDDVNIVPGGIVPLPSPARLKKELPMTQKARATVVAGRQAIREILSGHGHRLVIFVGPCSIHDPKAALEYARRLAALQKQLPDEVLLVMRVYFEKPRTNTGWRGMITEPTPGNGFEMERGLRLARQLLLEINKLGVPAATEFLDPIVPQYIADLVSWGAIGARTSASQTHRQMASGLSMPVGIKNGTDGSIKTAVDGIQAARSCQAFLGIDDNGIAAVAHTRGNPWTHLVLRGGKKPNCDRRSIAQAIRLLDQVDGISNQSGYPTPVIVDASHGNSGKDPVKQIEVCLTVVEQVVAGNCRIVGLMIEGNSKSGNQPISRRLRYGVSITDPCLGWGQTKALLRKISRMLTFRP